MKSEGKNQEDYFSDYTFSMFFHNYPYPVAEINHEGNILKANPVFLGLLKIGIDDLEKKNIFNFIHDKDKDIISKYLQKESVSFKTSVKVGKQLPIPIELIINKINNPELNTLLIQFNFIADEKELINNSENKKNIKKGKVTNLINGIKVLEKQNQELINEIREQKEKSKKIKKSEQKFRDLIDMLPEMVFEADMEGRITFINQRGLQMLGFVRVGPIEDLTIWQFLTKPDWEKTNFEVVDFFQKEENYPHEYYLIRNDQTKIPVEIHVAQIRNSKGELTGFRGVILDISERKKYEDKIRHLSFHDKLTDLYNRAYFEEELKRLNHKRKLPISIIIGDVNNLKAINDTFGHQHGDRLLSKIAGALRSCFRKSDIISRWGGDEFSIILPNTSREKGIEIINRIKKECLIKSTLTLPLSISMGIATKSIVSENLNAVVREAESNMYRYKIIDKQVADSNIINSLEKALQKKKYETKEYRKGFICIAIKFGKAINLTRQQLNDLKLLAMVCDIGKIAISEAIIFKKGWLSENEWEEIRKHPEVGFRIAKSSPEFNHIAESILYHHEYWDGNGYPHKIRGKEIPLLSRVIHIVNAYQSMTHERPYRHAMKKEDALKELKRGKGIQFDPELIDKFIEMVALPDK